MWKLPCLKLQDWQMQTGKDDESLTHSLGRPKAGNH